MGRKRTIDRDALLDAAEAIVTEQGAGKLTFDEIARRAGVSKGGVLYCFSSKHDLVAAMVERDLHRFGRDVEERRVPGEGGVTAHFRAHLDATRDESTALAARAASLTAALAETPDKAEPVRDYYRTWFERFDTDTPEGRRMRIAFLAAEAAFLLRGLGVARFSDEEWAQMFADMREVGEGR